MNQDGWVALGSVSALVTAIFTAAMAIAIILTARYAKRTLHATKKDSRERTRPVLVAFLEREHLSPGTILLIIRNFGSSTAADVKVHFDPEAPDAEGIAALPRERHEKWLYERFIDPVPVWAPGWSTSNVVRAGHEDLEAFTVLLSYTGPDGTPYDEKFALQPSHILNETWTGPSETDNPVKLGQQAIAALHTLVRTVRNR